MIREFAPAKVNLSLHVGPVRPDGNHELASLIVFAGVGDEVRAERSDQFSLSVDGPFAAPLAAEPAEDNLIIRAARALAEATGVEAGARLTLTKRLPVASGVGGGSADAAAAIRALVRLWRISPSPRALNQLAFRLGADVPVCLDARPAIVTGAGETVRRLSGLGPAFIALANPRRATPTGPIFRAFDAANPDPATPHALIPARGSFQSLVEVLERSRNDLEAPAIARVPVISEVIETLGRAPGARGARMSGSGATCFALFPDAVSAARAASRCRARGWWAASAPVLRGGDAG